MNPRKPAIAFASSLSASITSSFGAQGYEDFCLHVTVKWLIGRRFLSHQAWRRLSGGAVAFLGPEQRRPTVYSSSLPAAPAHARQLHGSGGGRRPGGAGDLLCLLLRQYVQEALERQEAMVGVVPTKGMDRGRMSVGLWLWLGAGAQVNILGEWQ